jgi:YgiT-type zinc finger domain-containing protein
MSTSDRCPICRSETHAETIPVKVVRDGREILTLAVPARQCGFCDHQSIADEVIEEVLARLEAETLPGDDIVFPAGATLH